MKPECDVLVIGGGAIGVCSAYFTARRGLKVALLEKGEICSGSSYGNAGLIVPSHCVPLAAPGNVSRALKWMFTPDGPVHIKPRFDLDLFSWLLRFFSACNDRRLRTSIEVLRRLSVESVKLFDELACTPGAGFDYEKKGYLRVYKTPEGLHDGVKEAELVRSAGGDARVLDSDGIKGLNPDIRIEVLGGILYAEDAHLSPAKFVQVLTSQMVSYGVGVHPFTEVIDFRKSGRRITSVRTTRGEFRAAEIVLAAGSWVPGIARCLGLRLPIQAAKGYSFTFQRPARCPAVPFSLGEAGVAVTPMGNRLRFAGTFDLAGLDFSLNRKRLAAILSAVPTYLPDLQPSDLNLLEIWRGLRPCTPDGLPLLGRSRHYDNLTIAAGHAMIGISLSPITGKLVSELAAKEEPSADISALAIERFGL